MVFLYPKETTNTASTISAWFFYPFSSPQETPDTSSYLTTISELGLCQQHLGPPKTIPVSDVTGLGRWAALVAG